MHLDMDVCFVLSDDPDESSAEKTILLPPFLKNIVNFVHIWRYVDIV
jgi:hypothetical protein